MGTGQNGEVTCGVSELLVFIGALVAGTGCSLFSKMLLDTRAIAASGNEEAFQNPLFQTWAMFLGMCGTLPIHWVNQRWNAHKANSNGYDPIDGSSVHKPVPFSTYMILILPAVFDLAATALCMFGLTHISVSIYQMLRGGAIVFVAILKHFVLQDKLMPFMWIGVAFNVLSIMMVGATAQSNSEDGTSNPLLGVGLILCGALVQSLQYAFEEKVMSSDVGAPPLLVIGMEGFWGLFLCTVVVYPFCMVYGIEDPYNTWVMFKNSTEIQVIFAFYFVCIFLYNILGVLVTYQLSSVWHAILDNFRPISVWFVDLLIFYAVTHGGFGEKWTWPGSYVQLVALFVLLYGTAVYNGSVKLPGFQYPVQDEDVEEPFSLKSPGMIIRASPSMNSSVILQSPLIRKASLRAGSTPDLGRRAPPRRPPTSEMMPQVSRKNSM